MLVTHDAVLSEMLTYFSGRGREMRESAARLAESVLDQFVVVPVERPLFLRSLELYRHRLDKEYSLIDCTSMIVMRDFGITNVVTHDHHFRQEGFTVLSDAP